MADALEETARRIREEQNLAGALSASAVQSYQTNPDQYAKQVKTARDTANPALALPEMSEEAKLQFVVNNFHRLAKESPATAEFLADPRNAKMAHPDADDMGGIERHARNFVAGWGGDFVGSGLAGVGQTLFALERMTGSKSILAQDFVDVGERTKKYWQSVAPTDQGFSDSVVRGLGQMAGQLPTAVASTPLSLLMMYGQGADIMHEKIAKDKAAQKADQWAKDAEVLSGGAITMATEWFSSNVLLGKLAPKAITELKNVWLGRAAKVALGTAEEGTQELLENIGQDMAHIAMTNPEAKIAFGEAIEAGGVGAIVGAVASSIVQGALHMKMRRTQQTLQDLSDSSKVQKLRERDPETYQGFADTVAAHLASTSEGAVTDVYVDANVFHQMMTEMNVDPDEVGVLIPSIGEQLDEAKAVNGDLVIPLGEYIGKMAGTDIGDALLPHLRAGVDLPSIQEVEAAAKAAPDLQKRYDDILAEKEDRKEFEKSAFEVQKAIYEQYQNAGVYSSSVNRTAASLEKAFYVNLASQLGVTPTEAYQAFPHRVEAAGLSQGEMTQGGFTTVYRGEFTGNKGGNYYSPDAEFARQFTQSGQDAEITQSQIKNTDIYKPAEAVYAGDPDAVDAVVKQAQEQGFKAVELSEGEGQPSSVFVFDESALKSSRPYDPSGTFRQSLSTRLPGGKKATEDPLNELLTVDFGVALTDESTLEKNLKTLEATGGFPKTTGKGARSVATRANAIIDQMANNLLFLHDLMPEELRQRAELWYDGGRKIVGEWSKRYGISEMQGAALIAVLSPQNDWYENVSEAERIADAIFGARNFKWDDAMSETAAVLAKDEPDPAMDAAKGKTLAEVLGSPDVAARWVRVYDQTHNNRKYRILTPEGGVGEYAKGPLRWKTYESIAKAISVLTDGRAENVYYQIGNAHKVRNFYNNLFDPNSPLGFTTIDTHAVAAALLRPLSSNDTEVMHAFGSGKGSSQSKATGLQGTYPIYVEAYRRAAESRGILPRQMQSITWEGVRGVFESSKKRSLKTEPVAIWERYRKGELTQEQAQQAILEYVGGMAAPTWASTPFNDVVARTYEGPGQQAIDVAEKPATAEPSRVFFEVAPDPNDTALTEKWNSLSDSEKLRISQKVATEIAPKVLYELGTDGQFSMQLGGYEGATNPSLALAVSKPELAISAARLLGYALSQDSMMVVSEKPFVGGEQVGVITIDLPDGYGAREVTELYDKLWKLERNGEKLIGGHSTVDGKMVILNYSGLDTSELAGIINEHLDDKFTIQESTAYSAFPNKQEYDYASDKEPAATGKPSVTKRPNYFRGEASQILQAELSKSGVFEQRGISATGVHYSKTHRRILSSNYFGSGSPSAEAARLENAPELKQRLYFYINTGGGIRPEPFVGSYPHIAQLENLYDATVDPLNIRGTMPANDFEREVMARGFEGFFDRDFGFAVLLGQRELPVNPVDEVGDVPEIAPAEYSPVQLLSQELKANRNIPQGLMTGPEWVKALKEDDPELYKRMNAEGYIAPLKKYKGKLRRTEIPYIKGEVLTQQGAGPRGGFSPSRLTTILTEKSDYSTFIHETAHFFLTTYANIAASPNAPAQIKADMQTLLNWFGVPDIETWNAMSLDEQRQHHEKFAYNYEIYVFENKAPSVKLQRLFERFSAWLRTVYQSIRGELNTIYKEQHGEDLPILTGEVRQVMDRMLASDEQIKQAEAVRGMMPIFQTQEESGMTDEEWAAYQDMHNEATETALASHRAASLRQMKWLSNAKSKKLKELQSEADGFRKAMREEVSKEVSNKHIYRAKTLLKTATEEEALAIADSLGYQSVADLKTAIRNAPKMVDVINELTDVRMLEEHGELIDPKALEAAVNEAIHNDARAKFIGVELRHLSKTMRPARVMNEAARQAARALLAKKAIKDIRPYDYTIAEGKSAKAAEEAIKKGDTAAATQAKEYELLNHMLASEALKAKAQVAKAQEAFKKVFGSDERLGKRRDMNYVNAARAILAHYGFGASEQPASFYLSKIKAYDPEFFAEIDDMITAHQEQARPLKDLTLGEFQSLTDQISALWHLSRRSKQIEIDGQLMDRKAVVSQLNDQTRTLNTAPHKMGYNKAMTKWEKTKLALMGGRAALRRVEAWVSAMDKGNPNGPFRKYIWNPISESVTRYRTAKGEYMTQYVNLLKEIEPLLKGGDIAAPEIGYTFKPQELLHAILHTGNTSNKRKLLLGREWATLDESGQIMDTTKWDAFITRAIDKGILTKAHYDFAQKVWDLLEQMKPAAQKAHYGMYGFYFDEVSAAPFETPFGVYAGGYVPAVTDPDIVTDAAMNAEKETTLTDNSFMFPTTGRGFTKSRVEYNKPLLLNLGYFASHMDKVLRFTHIEPTVKDVARIVKTNRAFASAMDEFDPTVRGDMLVPWLQRTAMQMVSTPSKGRAGRLADNVFRYIRNTTGMQMMVMNVVNTIQQFTGVSISMLKVKPRYLRNALWQYIKQPKDTMQMIEDKSEYMKTRVNSDQYELQKTMDEILLNPDKYDKLKDFAAKHGYFMQRATQSVVDSITWAGAYNQAVEQGMDEKAAVREADSAVRMTQGSFAPEDISRIETGSAFMRAFTQFYSYFNMQANLLGTEFLNTARDMGVKKGAGRLLYIYTFGYMAPALMAELIVQAAGGFDAGDDDDFELWDALRLFVNSQWRPAAAMVPGVGQLVTAAVNRFNNKYYDDRISTSPAISMLESSISAPYSVYKAIANDGSWKRASKDVLNLLGAITQIPVGPLGKPVGYVMDVAQGKVEPEGGMDVARGLISGKDVNRKQ